MPPIVTTSATITCAHGGRVLLRPGQTKVTAGGAPVLCDPDLVGSVIAGCTVPVTPTTKPCTMVVSTFPGSSNPKVLVGGRPVYLATLQGVTDSMPPAPLIVAFPGQTRVQA